jgi:hypothetical protein
LLLVACIPPRWQLVATSYKLRLDEEKDLFLLRSMDMPSLHRKWWCGDWGPGRKTRIGFSVNTERNGTPRHLSGVSGFSPSPDLFYSEAVKKFELYDRERERERGG